MTSFLFSAVVVTLLVFPSTLTTLTNAALVQDVDGDLLRNSGSYYVVPKGGHGGGLTLATREGTPTCPNYITKATTTPGLPLVISSPLRILTVGTSSRVSFSFNTNLTTCVKPLGWHVTTDKATGQSYVVSGGSSIPFPDYFTIEEVESGKKKIAYKIRHCNGGVDNKCGDVGFFRKDGLLGITNEKPLLVHFKKDDSKISGNHMFVQ